MGDQKRQGEQVTFAIAAEIGDEAITVRDSNGVLRPVQSYERFIIDMVSYAAEDISGATTVYIADSNFQNVPLIFIIGNNAATNAPISGFVEVPAEGIPLSVGGTPYLKGSSGLAIGVAGSGRIVATTQGVRAGYKELLTPGGNANGQ